MITDKWMREKFLEVSGRAIFTSSTGFDDMKALADAAYEKGKTEGEMSERIRVVGILKDKRLKTNALLLARQEIFREIDFGEKARNALKESERAKGRTMTDV